jgi:hypothetical protein
MKARTLVWLASLAVLLGTVQLASTPLSPASAVEVLRASGTSPVPPPPPFPSGPMLS